MPNQETRTNVPAKKHALFTNRIRRAFTAPAPARCPVTRKPEKDVFLYTVPVQWRALVSLSEKCRQELTRDLKGMDWTWASQRKDTTWWLVSHALREGGDHGKVYIELYEGWKYAVHPC